MEDTLRRQDLEREARKVVEKEWEERIRQQMKQERERLEKTEDKPGKGKEKAECDCPTCCKKKKEEGIKEKLSKAKEIKEDWDQKNAEKQRQEMNKEKEPRRKLKQAAEELIKNWERKNAERQRKEKERQEREKEKEIRRKASEAKRVRKDWDRARARQEKEKKAREGEGNNNENGQSQGENGGPSGKKDCLKWTISRPSGSQTSGKSKPGKHLECLQDIAQEALKGLTAQIENGLKLPPKAPEGLDEDTTGAVKALTDMGLQSKKYLKYKKTLQKGGLWEMERLGHLNDPKYVEQFKKSIKADILRINKNMMDETWRAQNRNIMDAVIEKQTLISHLSYLNERYKKPGKKNPKNPKNPKVPKKKTKPVEVLPPINEGEEDGSP